MASLRTRILASVLLLSAAGLVALAAVTYAEGRKVFCSNAELKISFLAAVDPGSELECTAEVVSGGRRVAFVEASVVARPPGSDAERLVARASSTYIFKERE